MNYKSISIFMAFLLIFGFLSFSFASYGDQEIPTLTPPPGGQEGGGSPGGNGNSSGGGNQTTTTTTTIQTGTMYVNQNSQDMVVVKRVSNITTNTTTRNESQPPIGIVILPRIPVPDPILIIVGWVKPVVPGLRDPDWPYIQGANGTFIPDPKFVHLNGNATTTSQVTPAGTVPHQVADPTGVTYYAFCMEPGQKAKVGQQLDYTDTAPAVVYDLVEKSNPDDGNNAYKTQIKIWAILTGGNINSNSGEVSLLKEEMGISDNQFKADVNTATEELKKEYGVKDGQISLLLDYHTVNILGYNMLENLFTGIKHLLGWYSPYKPLSESLSPYQNDTTTKQQSTPANTQTSQCQTSTQTPVQPGPNQQVCSKCGGTGQITEQYSYVEWVACTHCGGSGQIYDSIEQKYSTCPSCHGSGGSLVQKTGTRSVTCPVCGGKGVV